MAGRRRPGGGDASHWRAHDDRAAEQPDWDARHGGGSGFPGDAAAEPWGDRFGGFIFGCARHTEEECIQGGLFGLPESLAQTERGAIEALAPGLPLFLFNFQTRVLHGVFEATTRCTWNLDPDAFRRHGSSSSGGASPYPWQARARVVANLDHFYYGVGVARVLACPPLSEEEAFPVLAPNYLGGGSNKFRFSLTQQQVHALLELFDEAAAPAAEPAATATADTGDRWDAQAALQQPPRKRHRTGTDQHAGSRQAPKRVGISASARPLNPKPQQPQRRAIEVVPIEPTVLQPPRRSEPAAAGAKPAAKAPANAKQHTAAAQQQRQVAQRAADSANGAAALKRLPAPARDAAGAAAAANGQQQAFPRAGRVSQSKASVPASCSAGLTTAVLRRLPASATVSGMLAALPQWGVDASAVDFAHGCVLPAGSTQRCLVLNFTSAAELARLRAGAHGKPWGRLLPQGGAGASPQGAPSLPGTAAVDFYDIQGRAALEAHHGAKAKRLPPVSGCGHLRLPFAMPLFFAAPPAAPSRAAAAPAASASAVSATAVSAPASAASAAAAAAALKARPRQSAKPPAVSAGAAGGSAQEGSPGAVPASPTPRPQQRHAVSSRPSTRDLAQQTAPPQQGTLMLNGRGPARHEPHPSAAAPSKPSTASAAAPARQQSVAPTQPQPGLNPAAAKATTGVVQRPAAGSAALPAAPAAAVAPTDKPAAAAPSEAGLPARAAAPAAVQSAPALNPDAAAQAAGAAAGGAAQAQQAAQEPPEATRSTSSSAPAAGLGSTAAVEDSRAGQQSDATPATVLLDPMAAQAQPPMLTAASIRVHGGERAAADAVSTAAETDQDQEPTSPAFAFGSDFVQLPESPVVQ